MLLMEHSKTRVPHNEKTKYYLIRHLLPLVLQLPCMQRLRCTSFFRLHQLVDFSGSPATSGEITVLDAPEGYGALVAFCAQAIFCAHTLKCSYLSTSNSLTASFAPTADSTPTASFAPVAS